MDKSEFLQIYLPALKQALEHDSENSGYHVHPTLEYIGEADLPDVEEFIESKYDELNYLFDLETAYFDAVSHYFPSIGTMTIDEFKEKLQRCIIALSHEYKIPLSRKI